MASRVGVDGATDRQEYVVLWDTEDVLGTGCGFW